MTSLNNNLFDFFLKSPYGIMIFNEDGKIVVHNKSFLSYLFCDSEDISGSSISSCFQKDFYRNFLSEFKKVKKDPEYKCKYEYLYSSSGTVEKWVKIKIVSGSDYEGKKLYIAYFEDISELKEDHTKLESAKKIAEQATKTKSEFLANMSHEIRTPLHTIMGMTELLLETSLDVEQEEYGEQIFFSAEVLLNLINDILDFSKIEAGKLIVENISFDLYETLEAAVSLISMEAHKKDLEVILSIAPDVPEIITGDPVRIRQIIINLLNNAIKFTSKGEISISCSVAKRVSGRVVLQFAVRDTGIGIPESRKDQLFRSFTQVDSSVTRKYGGTGLGLSICKNLVHLFKGKIGVDSIEGKGSVFWFAFPTKEIESSTKKYFPAEKLPENFEVLIVDDNTRSRKQLRKYVEELGAFVYEAVSGRAAIEFLKNPDNNGSEKIDLIMIDKKMPGMDGWQLAGELNADPEFTGIKKILMTPVGKSGDEAKMKLLNWFDEYLNKPVKKWELYSSIYRALDIVVDIEPEKDDDTETEQNVLRELLFLNKKSVLLAEDYYVNQKLFKTILNNLNIDVTVANNGLEASEAAVPGKFDLIFMDIQMPVMNGYEAAVKIREKGVKIPIIAVTANAVAGEKKKCTEAGMDDFLTKPFKKGDLFPIIGKWLLGDGEVSELEEIDSADDNDAGDPLTVDDPEILEIQMNIDEQDSSTLSDEEGRSVFNYNSALDIFMGEKDVLDEVLSEFKERVVSQIASMKKLLDDSKFEDLTREAHSIKGGGLNLSMERLGDAAALLEKSAKEGNVRESERLIKKVAEEFEVLKKILENRADK